MLTHLADVSIRAILLAVPAAIILWMLRWRETAALRHAVWTSVVCGMLALWAFGQALPRLPLRILERPVASTPAAVPAASAGTALASESAEWRPLPDSVPVQPRRNIDWKDVAMYGYGAIAFGFLAQYVTGMFLVRRLMVRSRAAQGFFESELIKVPFTVGWLRPRILLPVEWREWDHEKLEAVLAHEGAHVRRRDGLVAALAGVNRCVFWFHPLAWMLERKLALLAEQACDESSVAALGDRQRYAHLLLEMALVVDRDHGRLRRHALTMAEPSHMRQRIDALLREGRTFSRGLSRMGWAAVMVCGIPLIWGAGALELERQAAAPVRIAQVTPAASAQSPQVHQAQAQALPAPQTPPKTSPRFDAASIKPCEPGDGAGKSGRGGGKGRGSGTSPGRLWVNCMSAYEMLDGSVTMGNEERLLNDSGGPFVAERIRGGPAWFRTERYSIDAETSDPVANGPTAGPSAANKLMRGTMLRQLLEDRFQLKLRREVEEVPMYALTVAKGGLKITPMEVEGCRPRDPTKGIMVGEMFPPGEKPMCVAHIGWEGPNWTIDTAGRTLGDLAGGLSGIMDRHVLDKTGVTDQFILHMVFAHDDKTPGDFPVDFPSQFPPTDTPAGPSVFTVLDRLGLKLVPDKGMRGYIVIDSVSRPSEN